MGSKRIILNIISNIVLGILMALAAGFLTAFLHNAWYLLLLLSEPFLVWHIIYQINSSNRQVAFFFEAIRNEDSSLKFPTTVKQKSLRRLYAGLNALNEQITEIKLQNEYLEKYYQTFIQHAATGLVALNGKGEVEIMNEKAFDYAGIPSYTPLHLVPIRNPEFFTILQQVNTGETLTYRSTSGNSQVNLLLRAKDIRYGGETSKLLSLQDIRNELDNKELETWQQLIRILTHEIMNSIAPVVSLTSTLRRFFFWNEKPISPQSIDAETIENVIQGLDTIGERGNGLMNFVNNYRKLTRIPPPEISSFALQEWLEHICLLMQEQMEQRKIDISVKIDARLQNLRADKQLLTQVIINILNNAIEALDEVVENRLIKISVEPSGKALTSIRISNNGPAIPQDISEKIFIPFFTTKQQGSGIGLSLSRQILRLHGGSIYAESNKQITSFILSL